MISLIEKILILTCFLMSPCVLGIDIQEELANLNVEDQGLLKEADFSDSLLEFANGSDQPLNLTSGDRETLKLLGYSDGEIDQLTTGTFIDSESREKLTSRLSAYGNKKANEVDEGVKSSLVPGLASSVIGLSLASLLGITVGVRCSSQPSALAFAGASGAWVGLEMMIWKGYQVKMKDIKALSEISKIPGVLSEKIKRAKILITEIETDFKTSDLADINVFLDSKSSEVEELKAIANDLHDFLQKAKDKQFGSLRSIHSSIELAAETSKKKARNAKVAAIGFTAASGVAAMEAFNVFSASGSCFSGSTENSSSNTKKFYTLLSSFLVKDAHAGFATVGDLDKIGIPVGAGLAAAYLGFKKKFADKIYASGTSRAVVFIAMAGIAYYASTKLDEAAKFLADQAKEMKLFIDTVENLVEGRMISFPSGEQLIATLKNDLLPSIAEVIENSVDIESIQEEVADLGKELGVETTEELEALAQEEIKNLNESDIMSELNQFGTSAEDLKSFNSNEFSGRVSYEKGYMELFLNSILTSAYAVSSSSSLKATPSCFYRTKTFVRLNESCSCRKSGNCSRTLFPTQVNLSGKSKSFQGIYQFAVRADKANNLIMHGNPDKGIQLYRGLYSKVAQVDAMARSIVSKKMRRPLSKVISSKMAGAMIRSAGPALPDYFKRRKVRKAPIEKAKRSPLLSKEMKKKKRNQKNLREKIQKNLILAKALGNQNLKRFEITASANTTNNGLEYVYDQESIVKDKSKNIFNIIKKRYLIMLKDGRL